VRRHFTLITLFSCQALVAALAFFLYFVTRPAFGEAYKDFPGHIPAHAILALSSWYLPALAGFAALCDLVALTLPKRSARNLAMGLGLVLPAFGLGLAVDGIFVPLFQAAQAP
jgi:hypothetical protein